MPALADRVKESTATTGQGTVTLAGAAVGFRSFTGAFGNGVSVYYVIAGGAEWEVGIGTTGAGTLSRDTVIASSAGGTTKVTFSAGTKDVFCSVPSSRLVLTDDVASTNTANAVVKRDGSGNFAAGTITASLTGNVTGNVSGSAGSVAASALTGNTLASGVLASSLTSVGTLSSLTVSGNVTVDTNTLFVDATNNRVGIGTLTPGAPFTVQCNALADGLLLIGRSVGQEEAGIGFYKNDGTTVNAYIFGTNQALFFSTGLSNTERWRISASGHFLAGADNSYDIGASGATRPRSVFVGTSVKIGSAGANAMLEVATSTGEVFRADAASGAARIIANQTETILGGNIALGISTSFGGGSRVVAIREAATVPSSNPVGNGLLYVEGGALKYRGTSGTVTTIANA